MHLRLSGAGGIVYTGTVTPSFEAGFSDVLLTGAGRLYWSESPFGGTPRVMYLDPGGGATFITSGPLGTIGYQSLRATAPDRLAALARLGTRRVLIGIENISSPNITVYLAEARVAPSSRFTELISGIGLNSTPEIAVEAWVADLGNFAPVINDAGLVAFRGVGTDGQDAIYVGGGTTLVTVVRETDVVPTDLGPAQIGNETAGTLRRPRRPARRRPRRGARCCAGRSGHARRRLRLHRGPGELGLHEPRHAGPDPGRGRASARPAAVASAAARARMSHRSHSETT